MIMVVYDTSYRLVGTSRFSGKLLRL